MKKLFFALMLGLAVAASCTPEYDDTAINDRMDKIEQEAENLDAALNALMERIAAAEKAIDAINKAAAAEDYVVSVVASEDGKGVLVSFKNAEAVFIPLDLDASKVDGVVISDVKVSEETATFTYTDGTEVVLPLYKEKAFALVLETAEFTVNAGETVKVAYTVEGATKNTVVDVLATSAGYVAKVTETHVEITVPSPFVDGDVLVWADNGAGKTSIKKVSFEENAISVEAVAEVAAEGGEVVIKGVSNVEVTAEVVEGADWLTAVPATKAEFAFKFNAAANEGEARTAKVAIKTAAGVLLQEVTVAQAAGIAPFAELVKAFQSHGADSYMAALGGSAGKDRNIAINDEYLFIPETQGSPVMWKVSLADGAAVKMPVGTVVGANVTFAMSCPRFLKNTDETINGGKDVLVVSSMGMGGQEGYLYFYNNGLEADPHKVALNLPGSGGRRIGDKMSVYGTMQNWGIYYKEQGSSAIINYGGTYRVLGVDNIWAAGRNHMDPTSDGQLGGIYFYDFATAGKKGVISTVENFKYGVINESVVFEGKAVYEAQAWGTDPKLAGCHGFNFFKHNEKDYIAYTNFPAKKLVIIEGAANADGVQAALEAHKVVFEASIAAEDNACTSGNSAADCSVYQKDGNTYVAGHVQNVGVVVYKLN